MGGIHRRIMGGPQGNRMGQQFPGWVRYPETCGVKKLDRGRDLERVARIPCRSRWSSAGSDRHLIMELGPVDTSGTGVGERPTEGCQRHVR
jgi:hypothetical protein